MPSFAVFLFSLFILLHRATPKTNETKIEQGLDRERHALLRFIEAVKKDPSYNWIAMNQSDPCSWKGVFCDPTNTTIIQLSLPAAKLIGEIPPYSIGNLSSLLRLSLHTNNLSGTIPFDFCNLALNELYLHNNSFSGHLWNINADDLEQLDVSYNSLTCPIPLSLNRFPNTSFVGNTLYRDGSLISSSSGDTVLYHYSNTCRVSDFPEFSGPMTGNNFSWPYFSNCSRGYERSKKKRKIVGICTGLGLLLLILLCCVGKRIYKRRKQPPKLSLKYLEVVSGSGMSTEGARSNKLVLFDDGINGFDCDKLLLAPVEFLGKGSVGTTYKRVLEEKKTTVVLKRLKDVVVRKADFESHMEVLGKMKNKNVVSLRGYCYYEDERWLVYDYINGGSLSAYLHGSIGLSETRLKWEHRKRIALSTARGLAYLHANNIVHGNIKSSNILLQQETNKDFVAKVSDYGLNTLFEVVKTHDFSMESDVYSFGVLLLELLTGKAPNYQASAGWNDFPKWVESVVCEEPNVEIFDVDLRRDHNIDEMFQMLRIAKDCVSVLLDQRPTMPKVVSMMEEMNPVDIDDWFRQSSDHGPSKGYDDTPSTTFTRATPSTVTP